jgi:hypothetical protein
MKKTMIVLVLCGLATAAFAQEQKQEKDWTTTVDLSYTSRYIWRGYDVLDNAGAFQPSVDFLHSSGLGATLWMSYAERGGSTGSIDSRADMAEYDYTVYYKGKAFAGDCFETNYKIGWRYYDYIRRATKELDKQEVFLEFEMPQLTGTPLIPRAGIYQIWPSKSDSQIDDCSGTIYLMGFSYLLPTEEMLPNLPLTFSWDIAFNDGTMYSDHDWSHMVWGLETKLTCPFTGAKIVPAFYFQNSFEDTVNKNDEYWGTISYSFAF